MVSYKRGKSMRKYDMYKKRCKECKKEILVVKPKEELCWECKEKIKRGIRRSNI